MVGQTLSHYTIIEKLGEGGMGVVYKAHDTKLDRDVALKFLPATLRATPDEILRFYQEARAISALNHPNIATIFDVDETDGCHYLVLEYIPGGTLGDKMRAIRSEKGQLPTDDVLDYGIQIAEALAHAHRHGIVHRDVKTENMMLSAEGAIKLTDFGLARLREGAQLTSAGTTLGTAAYMSPEHIRAESIDHRSDIFSFGIMLYELATSHLPFRGDFAAALSYSILNDKPDPIASLRADFPGGFQQVIDHCLEKDPAQRYQDAAEIAADLKKLRDVPSGGGVVTTKHPLRPLAIAASLIVLLATALWYIFSFSGPSEASSKTVAVLPFVNLAGDKEEEYFSDGITEDVLTQLAKIADLNVISRTSVMQYKATTKSIPEIGKDLNAGFILEGSVRHAGNQVRIVAQLIDARSDKHLWAETYDREYKQIFTIQSEIAQQIAAALKARLSPVEVEQLKSPLEANTAAYSLFLQGRYFANRRDGPNTNKAIDFYLRALAIDSTDARIWVALSDAYFQQANIAWEGTENPISKAREAARRSIALDEKSADGHRVLALIMHVSDWDWQGAEKEFRKALELEPGNATIIYQMSYLAASIGKFDEAIMLGKKAIALDPVLDRNYFALAFTYHYVGRHAESISLCRKTLELSPQYPDAHTLVTMNYLALGKPDSAIAEALMESTDVWRRHGLALSYFAAGRKREADEMLAEMIEKDRLQGPFQIAEAYAFRGEADSAFFWLDEAYRLRDGGISQILGDPQLRNIEKDPRFAAFLSKLKLGSY